MCRLNSLFWLVIGGSTRHSSINGNFKTFLEKISYGNEKDLNWLGAQAFDHVGLVSQSIRFGFSKPKMAAPGVRPRLARKARHGGSARGSGGRLLRRGHRCSLSFPRRCSSRSLAALVCIFLLFSLVVVVLGLSALFDEDLEI